MDNINAVSPSQEQDMPTYRVYNWHPRKELFDYQESKLYDSTLIQSPLLFSPFVAEIDFATAHEIYVYINNNISSYELIYDRIREFKLVKSKKGEDFVDEIETVSIPTRYMEPIYDDKIVDAAITLLILQKEQRLWSHFVKNYAHANIYYKKKKETESLTPENSRCIVDCDNILKYVNRYIKCYMIDPVYETGNLVNTDIHRARKCILKTFSRQSGTTDDPIYYSREIGRAHV